LERRSGNVLFHPVGLLEVGPADGIVVPGVRLAAEQYRLEIENLTAAQAGRRFPGLRVPDDCEAVFERQAGYLRVELCVRTHIEQARRLGAEFVADQEAVAWSAEQGAVEVRTRTRTFTARRLVIAGGAWSSCLLADLQLPLRVLRKHLHWYPPDGTGYREAEGCPAFFYEMPEGYYYGFPARDPLGVKVAEHSGGDEVADPLTVDRSLDPAEQARVERFLEDRLPGVRRQAAHHAVCMYTMSPDEHFIVDRHPLCEEVVFAAGLSGHGFKFATVLGRVLADLTLEGATELPIDFLSLRRFRDSRRE
jgi:monomeric sarcosine oxidase